MNILSLYADEIIDKDELIILYIVFENNNCSIKQISKVISNTDRLKQNLENLYLKKFIDIDWDKNKVKINSFNNVKEKKELDAKYLDKIRVIINREIAYHELEMIKKWYAIYGEEKIIDAIYKAILKDIDNFKYIEKILQNNDEAIETKNSNESKPKLKKNFDFFS